jgi:hypothetical protein
LDDRKMHKFFKIDTSSEHRKGYVETLSSYKHDNVTSRNEFIASLISCQPFETHVSIE